MENIRNTTTHVCGFCLRLGCVKDFLSKILHKSALSCPLYSLTEMSLRCLALVAVCVVFISTEAVSGWLHNVFNVYSKMAQQFSYK